MEIMSLSFPTTTFIQDGVYKIANAQYPTQYAGVASCTGTGLLSNIEGLRNDEAESSLDLQWEVRNEGPGGRFLLINQRCNETAFALFSNFPNSPLSVNPIEKTFWKASSTSFDDGYTLSVWGSDTPLRWALPKTYEGSAIKLETRGTRRHYFTPKVKRQIWKFMPVD